MTVQQAERYLHWCAWRGRIVQELRTLAIAGACGLIAGTLLAIGIIRGMQ